MKRRQKYLLLGGAFLIIASLAIVFFIQHRLSSNSSIATLSEQPVPRLMQNKTQGAHIVLQGAVQAARCHDILAPAGGQIVALFAAEGQPVAESQLLFVLDDPSLRQSLAAAQAEVARLKKLQDKASDPRLWQEIRSAQAAALEAKRRLQQAKQELRQFQQEHPEVETIQQTYAQAEKEAVEARAAFEPLRLAFEKAQREIAKKGHVPSGFEALQQKYLRALQRQQEAQTRLVLARQERARIRADILRLELLRRRIASGEKFAAEMEARWNRLQKRPEARMMAEGLKRLKEAEEALARLEKQRAALTIKAPVAGTLAELYVRPGQNVPEGQLLARIQETGGARFIFRASPQLAQKLSVGQRAQISVPRHQSIAPFRGTISQIAPDKDVVWIYIVPLDKIPSLPPGTALTARL